MHRVAPAGNRRGTRGGAVRALMLCLLPGLLPGLLPVQGVAQTAAQTAGQLSAPLRLSAADLPELTLASSDGLRIGRAAMPEAAPQLPPARTAARVPAIPLAPADPDVAVLAPVAPAVLPEATALAVLAPVMPATAPRATSPDPLPVALAAPAPQVRPAPQIAAAVPQGRLPRVVPAPLASKWPDPQDPADRSVLDGIFGAALPPGLMLEPPAPADPKVLALAVQTELQRLNCYLGALDGDWGRGSRSALEAYGKAAGTTPDTLDPTPALLQQLQARPDAKLCPDPAKPKPATTAAPATRQQAKPPAQKQQPAAKPAPKQQPAKPAKKQPDIAIIGL
jgi:hypothetical protein